ncbi:MAG TPA: ABC transporter permease [Gemmataceae bacterium]|nr:ABC transporter permease [Gemmataceae bacterium]
MQTLRDTWLVFLRYLRQSLRNPIWVLVGMAQPVMYLALFGPLLQGVSKAPGFPSGDAWQVYVPGLLVQMGMFGCLFVGFGIIGEWRLGVLERMRVTPVSRLALLLGRVMRDALMLLVQSVILVAVGYALGLRAPLIGVLVGLGFVLLLAVSAASLSYTAGLATKNEGVYAPVLNMVALPLLLLSGILLPMSLAPGWLNLLSSLNPLRHIVEGMRDAFQGELTTAKVGIGLAIALALAAVSLAAGTRTFRKEHV